MKGDGYRRLCYLQDNPLDISGDFSSRRIQSDYLGREVADGKFLPVAVFFGHFVDVVKKAR